jgi:hypothetical protein
LKRSEIKKRKRGRIRRRRRSWSKAREMSPQLGNPSSVQ